MSDRSFYPADLCEVLRQRWLAAGYDSALLPSNHQLQSLIDAAYQASLLREEDDPVRCRIIVAAPDDRELRSIEIANRVHVVKFEESVKFAADRIRKMASAVGYYRSLIGVHFEPSQAETGVAWGLVVTGPSWVNHTETTVHEATNLPNRLVIHILGPGHLIFALGLTRVVETTGGRLLTEGIDPFRSKWLPKHFEPFRAHLLSKVTFDSPQESVRLCDDFVRDVAQNVVRRVLSLVRGRGRGGMLIYLGDVHDLRLKDWLRIRMRFEFAQPTSRFEQLMLRLMMRALEVGAANGIEEVRWKDFLQMADVSLGELHEDLIEFSHFLADLMSVDGALVLDGEFRLIGFGAEILGDSHVTSIERSLDLEGHSSVTEAADASGTRHRSAYRLVSTIQDSIAVVISQDGAVSFVAHRNGRLMYWPYLP